MVKKNSSRKSLDKILKNYDNNLKKNDDRYLLLFNRSLLYSQKNIKKDEQPMNLVGKNMAKVFLKVMDEIPMDQFEKLLDEEFPISKSKKNNFY